MIAGKGGKRTTKIVVGTMSECYSSSNWSMALHPILMIFNKI